MRMCGGLEYPGLDRLHNLKGTERILLNGDLMFCSTFDFNELGTAKIAHRQPLRYVPVDKPQRHGGAPIVGDRNNRLPTNDSDPGRLSSRSPPLRLHFVMRVIVVLPDLRRGSSCPRFNNGAGADGSWNALRTDVVKRSSEARCRRRHPSAKLPRERFRSLAHARHSPHLTFRQRHPNI